jgi:hypothetical protein
MIKVTGATNAVNIPTSRSLDELFKPGDALGSRIKVTEPSYAPVLPLPGSASPVMNRQLQEFLDKKNNWMLQSPQVEDRDAALKRIFGVKETDFSGAEQKPKSAVERFFQSDREQRAENSDMNPLNRKEQDPSNRFNPGRDLSFQDRPSGGIIPELNPALLFQGDVVPLNMIEGRERELRGLSSPQFGETPERSPLNLADPQKSQSQRDFERLLDPRKPAYGRWNDPINQQSDATRLIINPITARKPSVPLTESAQGRTPDALGMAANSPLGTRPDLPSHARTTPLGGSSMAPAIAAPAAGPVVQPKPPVLEIPRPKF